MKKINVKILLQQPVQVSLNKKVLIQNKQKYTWMHTIKTISHSDQPKLVVKEVITRRYTKHIPPHSNILIVVNDKQYLTNKVIRKYETSHIKP